MHAKTLEEATYKLKISNKVTDEGYQHSTKLPIYGSGQGAANSPAVWAFISSKLFTAHTSRANGCNFKSPEGDISLHMAVIGFVDDSTIMTDGQAQEPVEELLKRIQEDGELWSKLLFTSG